MDDQQQQQWIVVKNRKRKHIEKSIRPEKVFVKGGGAAFSKQVNISLEQQFLNNPSTQTNKKAIIAAIEALVFENIHIVCLGIGNFLSYLKPQIQMLFLRHCIAKSFQQSKRLFKINIYDPVFINQEKQEIKSLQASCQQFEKIEQGALYVMYMPHCDRFLYQKLCSQKIQHPNCQILVIGNSINQYKQRCLITNEQIPESFRPFAPRQAKIKDFRQAFNDTYIYTL